MIALRLKQLQMLQMKKSICNNLKTLYTINLYTTVTDVTLVLVKVYRELVIQKSPLAFTYNRFLKSLFFTVTICNTITASVCRLISYACYR